MTSYLQEQITRIFDRHKDEIDEISIIIPNRRAAVYIQKYLSELYQKPIFSPEILTIHDWVKEKTDKYLLGQTELLFILYEVHCEIEQEKKEAFENFMQWGKIILNDFDEIDKYLIEPAQVFKSLKDIKALESWDLEPDKLGEHQEKFQQIWDKLPEYYAKLEQKLFIQHCTYSGRAQQELFQNITKHTDKEHYYFIGFNALSKVESSIMEFLINEEKATVLLDVDEYYLNIPNHEAAHFYRKTAKEWSLDHDPGKTFNSSPKHFEIVETSQQIGQAKIAGSLAKKLIEQGEEQGNTAIVLADESLLIPLTKSLPANIETANITMGWPIKFSHLRGFLDIIFEFQFNFKKFNSDGLYHKTLINLLQHPYVQEILEDKAIKDKIQKLITEGNQMFIDLESLLVESENFERLQMILFAWGDSNKERIKVFEQLNERLYQTFKDQEDKSLDLEVIYQFNQGLDKFKRIIDKYDVEMSLRSFRQLFYQFWQAESLSFFGNPTDGLQIMGILESRGLDFKNLILIGMNEGALPKNTGVISFIPRDLRLYLGLPVEEDRQAIYAHHFYRLLHRAENVYMTYNSHDEGLGSGEKSRYIVQLENELDQEKHSLIEYTYSGDNESSDTNETVYKSTSEVHDRLDAILNKGLSPSALNKLIQCPLDFYYRYILKFDEEDSVEESIESSTFGTKIHTVLQDILEDNFQNEDQSFNPLELVALKGENKKEKITTRLESAYINPKNPREKKFSKNDLKYGENKLSFDVSSQFIGAFLNEQIKEVEQSTDAVIPVMLEEDLEAHFELDILGKKRTINLFGQADRIDKQGGTFRIIDYKSGKCNSDKLKLPTRIDTDEGLDKLMEDTSKGYARQLLMYALMFRQKHSDMKPFKAGIVSMVNISEWFQTVNYNNSEIIDESFLDRFEEKVLDIIRGLYDPEFEFKHNSDSDYCEHCNQ